MALNVGALQDYDEIFEDHNDIREQIDSLKFEVLNFRIIFSKYNFSRYK